MEKIYNRLCKYRVTTYERIQEISDLEKSIDRAKDNWKRHGLSEKWIQQRMDGAENTK